MNDVRIKRKGWWREKSADIFLPRISQGRRRSSWTLWSSSGSRSYGWDQWRVIGPTTKKQWDEANPSVFLYRDVSLFYCGIPLSIIYLISHLFKSLQSLIRVKTYDLEPMFSSPEKTFFQRLQETAKRTMLY